MNTSNPAYEDRMKGEIDERTDLHRIREVFASCAKTSQDTLDFLHK